MYTEFYTLPKGKGICCEHCGTYIQNVNVIHFDDGFVLKCGNECFDKLMKQSNISEYGMKTLKKMIKFLKVLDTGKRNWERWQTPQEAELDECWQRVEDKPGAGIWRIRTQEEFEDEKEFLLKEFYPYQIKRKQDEIRKKFKNVAITR